LATFFQGLNATRVVVEVGTHSAWVQEVISGCGHEVLVDEAIYRQRYCAHLRAALAVVTLRASSCG
jgi:hypothetical protein